MKCKFLLSIAYLIFFISANVFSQTPGNVSNNLKYWVKADTGVLTPTSNFVSQWNDISANPNIQIQASKPATNNVTLQQNIFNYNPALVYDGATSQELVGNANPSNWEGALTIYSIHNYTGLSPANILEIPGVWDCNYKGLIGLSDYWMVDGYEAYEPFTANTQVNTVKGTKIISVEYTQNSTYNSSIFQNGKRIENFLGSGAKNAIPDVLFEVGGRTKYDNLNDRIFEGNLAEIAVYKGLHTLVERNKIHTYLAIKYGLTLDKTGVPNYLSSNGNTIFSDATGDYWRDIVGIGRDDDAGLLQKQSQQQDDSTRWYINNLAATNKANTGNFSNNNAYIVSGRNSDPLNIVASNEYPIGLGIQNRIGREWKVVNTNFNTPFNIDFHSNLGASINPSNLRMLVSTTDNFITANMYAPTFSVANGIITVNGITATMIPENTTRFITFVSICTLSAPTVSVTQPTCTNPFGTITVSSPTGTGLSYSINGVDYTNTSGIFNNVAANTYNISVKNNVGCTSLSTLATINPQPSSPVAPTVSITQPTCTNPFAGITISAPIGTGLSYSIDGVDYTNTSGIFNSVIAANTYNVTVKNINGCTSTAYIAVINPQPTTPVAPTVSITQPTCTNPLGVISISAPVGTGLSYSIDGVNYTNITGVFNNVVANTYKVTVKNANGCTSAATVAKVNAPSNTPSPPTVSITQPTCTNPVGSIKITSPLSIGLSYSINGVDYTNTSGIFNNIVSNSYNVTVKNTNGCTSAATVAIINPQPTTPAIPTVNITQPTCNNALGIITISAPVASGLSYSIDGVNYTNTTGVFNNVVANTYSVTVKNSNGCTSAAKIAIINPPPPTPSSPTVSITQPTCTIPLGVIIVTSPIASGLSYSIDGVDYSNTTGIFNNVVTNSYNVTVKNTNGCISPATAVTINAISNTPSSATVSITQPTCNNPLGTITITNPVGSGYSYSIDGVNYTNTTGVFTNVGVDTYKVSVKNSAGCISTPTLASVNSFQPFKLNLTASPNIVLPGSSVKFTVTGNHSFTILSWLPTSLFTNQNAITQTIVVNDVSNYSVIGKTTSGCIDTAFVVITLQKSDCPISFPNAFSPNGDGINDNFLPKAICVPSRYSLTIYNRWGIPLFSTTNFKEPWTGKNGNKQLPVGTYYYVVSYLGDKSKTMITASGNITLLK